MSDVTIDLPMWSTDYLRNRIKRAEAELALIAVEARDGAIRPVVARARREEQQALLDAFTGELARRQG